MRGKPIAMAVAMLGLLASAGSALAQKTSIQAIEEYREMLQDGNPADLFEAKGEDLWKQKRGPKNASLERCDLGKGPGVVKGAFVELPRWFADTGKVQDLESRLITCMSTLQGIDPKAIINGSWGKGERANTTALATWIAAESKGMAFNLPQSHAQERVMYQVGKRLFYQRGGAHDFACASCHGEEGKRIRLQDLPDLRKNPGDGIGFAAWPAYRVPPERLLSPAALPRARLRQRRHRGPGRVPGRQRQGRQVRRPHHQALSRRHAP